MAHLPHRASFWLYIESMILSVTGPSNYLRPPRGGKRCAARCGGSGRDHRGAPTGAILCRSPGAVPRPLAPLSPSRAFGERRHGGGAHAPLGRLHGADAALRTAAAGEGGAEAGCASPTPPHCSLRRGRPRAAAFAASLAAALGRLRLPPFLSVGAARALRAHARARAAAAPALYRPACAHRLPWGRGGCGARATRRLTAAGGRASAADRLGRQRPFLLALPRSKKLPPPRPPPVVP